MSDTPIINAIHAHAKARVEWKKKEALTCEAVSEEEKAFQSMLDATEALDKSVKVYPVYVKSNGVTFLVEKKNDTMQYEEVELAEEKK